MAESQYEDDSVSFYFWKTNLLHRYFASMVENRRICKMVRLLEKLTLKVTFRWLRREIEGAKRGNEVVSRYREAKKGQLLFKAFNNWKNYVRNLDQNYDKLRYFKAFKQKELI